MQKITPVFFKGYQYLLLIVGSLTGLVLSSVLSSFIFDPPRTDYQALFGDDYLGYVLLNWSMLVFFAMIFVIMGLIFAENLLHRREYHASEVLETK